MNTVGAITPHDAEVTLRVTTKRGEIVRILDADLVAHILRGTAEGVEELARCAAENCWLLCGCGTRYYIREGRTHCRHPGQESQRALCDLCSGRFSRTANPSRPKPIKPARPGDPLVVVRKVSDTDGSPTRGPGGGGGGRNADALVTRLHGWLTAASLDLVSPVPTPWPRLRAALALEVSSNLITPWSELAWMPDSTMSPIDLYRRAAQGTHEVQIPIFGLLDERPQAHGRQYSFEVPGLPGTLFASVPDHTVFRIGTSPPYLVLAVARHDPIRGFYVCRVVLRSIAGEDLLVPVDSSFERDVAAALATSPDLFRKPLLDLAPGIRPDFMCFEKQILIEVCGMESAEYHERKQRVYPLMLELLPGWTLLEYVATPGGHSVRALLRRLEHWWRPDNQVPGWTLPGRITTFRSNASNPGWSTKLNSRG